MMTGGIGGWICDFTVRATERNFLTHHIGQKEEPWTGLTQGCLKHLLYVPAGQRGPMETCTLPARGWGLRGQREDGCRGALLLMSGLLPALP